MDVIHWYPGHMKKASNEMREVLKMIDIVIELVDARSPNNTRNEFFSNLIKDKKKIVVYSKADLADLSKIKLDNNSILLSNKNKKGINELIKKIDELNKDKKEKQISKGIKPQMVKAMIVGIPNIGKSSLINTLANKAITSVMNKPGLTKKYRWINVKDKFYLLDTPGILPSNYNESNYILGILGAIKIDLLPIYELSEYAYKFMITNYPEQFLKRYTAIKESSNETFKHIEDLRGIRDDKSLDHTKARSLFLKELRDGILGPIYID